MSVDDNYPERERTTYFDKAVMKLHAEESRSDGFVSLEFHPNYVGYGSLNIYGFASKETKKSSTSLHASSVIVSFLQIRCFIAVALAHQAQQNEPYSHISHDHYSDGARNFHFSRFFFSLIDQL